MLRWIIDRCEGRVDARETPVGYLPYEQDIDTSELDISKETMHELLSIDTARWKIENDHFSEYLDTYGDRVPIALRDEQQRIATELEAM